MFVEAIDLIEPVPRLSELLFEPSPEDFGSLAAVSSNVLAIEAVQLFAAGRRQNVAIVGPSGWGKSHLLQAVSYGRQSKCLEPCPVIDAIDCERRSEQFDSPHPLLLDNVQEVLDKPKMRQTLRAVLAARAGQGHPSLLSFTAGRPTRQMRAFLPGKRAWDIVGLHAATSHERLQVLRQMSEREGLCLDPRLMRLLASKMRGNGRTLLGALKRLKLEGSEWTEPRQILWACGILNPFFADTGEWDLRERIARFAGEHPLAVSTTASADLRAYLLIRGASLCEVDVARFLNQTPGEVYFRSLRFERALRECAATRQGFALFLESLVEQIVER